MSNKEPIVLMLKDIEKLAKRINVLMRKLNAMGLQEEYEKVRIGLEHSGSNRYYPLSEE